MCSFSMESPSLSEGTFARQRIFGCAKVGKSRVYRFGPWRPVLCTRCRCPNGRGVAVGCVSTPRRYSQVSEKASQSGEYGLRVIWAAGINDDRGIARHVSKRFLPMERDAIRSAGAKDKGGVKTDVRLRVTEQIAQAGHVGCGSGSLGSGGGKGGMPGLGVGASG